MPRPRIQHEMTHPEYERAIRERFVAQFRGPEFMVIGGPKIRWPGRLSGDGRQIDVGVVRSDCPSELVLVADAKRHGRVLNVTDVDAFAGFLDDIGCKRGVLASLLGGSPSACRRAASRNVELHVVTYAEALAYAWDRLAAGLCLWDRTFHPLLTEALARLNRGNIREFIDVAEQLPFEEWKELFSRAPDSLGTVAHQMLRAIAEYHHEDQWRFNALQTLDESYGDLSRPWLEGLRELESDPETRELLDYLLAAESP